MTKVRKIKLNPFRAPEFPLFPHSWFRHNPAILNIPLRLNHNFWHRRDTWRYHDFFSVKNRLRAAFPGLLVGSLAVAGYVGYDLKFGGDKVEDAKWEEWLRVRNIEKGVNQHEHEEH